MATPLFPDQLKHYGQPPPDWLQGAIESASAFLAQNKPQAPPPALAPPAAPAPAADTVPEVLGAPPQPPVGETPSSLTPQAPASLGAPEQPQSKPAPAPLPFGSIGKGLPGTGSVKNSRQAADRESALLEESAASAAAARDLQQQAEDERAAGLVEAQRQYVANLGKAQEDYGKARQTAAETTATKLAAEESRIQALMDQEIDPNRWWSNKSTLGKVGLVIGMLAHAMGSNPQAQSTSLRLMEKFAAEDIEEQKAAVAKKLAAARERKEDIRLTKAEELAAAKDDFGMTITRLDAMDKQLQLAAQTMGGDQRRLANLMAARSELANIRAKTVASYGDKLHQREMAGAARAHDMRMTQIRMMAEAQQNAAKAQAEAAKDLRILPPELSNVRIVSRQPKLGPDGKPMLDREGKPVTEMVTHQSRAIHKDYIKEAAWTVTAANKQYYTAQRALEKLEKGGNIELLLNTDPELNQLIQVMRSYIVTDPSFQGPGSKVSDKDMQLGAAIPFGRMGEEGWLSTVTNLKDRNEMAKAGLKYFIKRQPEVVNTTLLGYPTPEGASLYWEPPKIDVAPDPEAAAKYMTDQEQEAEVANITNVQTGRELVPRGTQLAPMTSRQVEAARAAEEESKGATAEGIVAEARRRLYEGADTPEEQKAANDALFRFNRANAETLDKARERQLRVANALAKEIWDAHFKASGASRFAPDAKDQAKSLLDKYSDPAPSDIKRKMEAAGFSAGKLSREDYAKVADQVEEILRSKAKQL